MGVILYCLGKDLHSEVAVTAVEMAFLNLGSTIGAYVFHVTWQDISAVRSHNENYGMAYGGYPMISPREVDTPED